MALSLVEIKFGELSIDASDPYKSLIKDSDLLDSGGFGRIFRCQSRTNEALECIVKEVDIPKKYPANKYMNKAVDHEESVIKKLIELHDHQNIVKIILQKRTKSQYLVFMEYMPGGDLHDFIEEHGALDKETALAYLGQIANGLKFLHSHRIAHLDLKSPNILLDNAENPKVLKICDYGMSKTSSETSRTTTFEFRGGTKANMAPEVLAAVENESRDLDEKIGFNRKSDIWSLGVIGLHLASGSIYSKLPSDIHAEFHMYETTTEKGNSIASVLKCLLVIDPLNRCDVDTAIKLIEHKYQSEVTCEIESWFSTKDKPELKRQLLNHFTNHHNDDNAIQVALEIIKSFDKWNWYAVSCNNKDDVSWNGHINVKVEYRQHMFYTYGRPTWGDATKESVKLYLNSIQWTTKSAIDVSGALINHFNEYWYCVISPNNDTTVYRNDIIVRLNNDEKFITVIKWWNY